MPAVAGDIARAPAGVSVAVNGVRIEMIERGKGRPLLFLHPGIGIEPNAAVLDRLAERAHVLAPSHPGFGASDLPQSITTAHALAYFYLDLMDQLDLRAPTVVGWSFGAWSPAAIVLRSAPRGSR